MIKVVTESGFECEVNENIGNDWRVTKALVKTDRAEGFSQVGAVTDLVTLILGEEGEEALCSFLENKYGYVPTDQVEKIISEVFKAIGETDELKNS